jgi:hypothetical protein
MNQKITLHNSTTVLVLGICSIVFSCVFAGLVLGIIGLVLGNKSKKIYNQNPEYYEGYGNLNAGYIMSIIGTVLGGLSLIYWLFYLSVLGFVFGAAGLANAAGN